MNPDLRAIEAALRGEPHDPSNLSPEAAAVVLPLVRRVVQERDDARHEIDMLRRERHAERQRVDERDQDVAQLREALEEEGRKSEERRRALLAECMGPEGGADLGFTPIMGKWFKPDGDRDEFGLWPRWWVVYRDNATANVTLELRDHGRYVTASCFVTQRSAMKAALSHAMGKA